MQVDQWNKALQRHEQLLQKKRIRDWQTVNGTLKGTDRYTLEQALEVWDIAKQQAPTGLLMLP